MRELGLIALFVATTACGGGQSGVDPRELLSREATPVAEGAEGTGDSGTATAGSGEAFDLSQCTRENPCRGPFPPGFAFCERADLQAVIVQAREAISACYVHHLGESSGVEGTVITEWLIELDGTVSTAETTSDNPALEVLAPCLNLIVRNLEFVQPNGGRCNIRHPFAFGPNVDPLSSSPGYND